VIRIAFVMAFTGFSLAAEPERAMTPLEKLVSLQAGAKKAEDNYHEAVQALPDTLKSKKEADELWKAFDKANSDRFDVAVEIAKADPKTDDALAILEWVLSSGRGIYLPAGGSAIKLVTEYHADNPKIGKLTSRLAWYPPSKTYDAHEPVIALLTAVSSKNPDRTARGQVYIGLTIQAVEAFDLAERMKGKDVEALAKAAEVALESIVKDYGDCRWLFRGEATLAEKATCYLFDLRNLRVGKVAPAIEGEDLDGNQISTDDAKGKVRVIVFWATWCGQCIAMVPHEVKLNERMKGRDYVFFGVNGDSDRAKAKKVSGEKGMAWKSFWSGKGGPDGGIAESWNVSACPPCM
jgi:thiol-disulfide isomerase/thioredoxin